jgi:hypothetical protein
MALSENIENRNRQLRYLYGSGVFDESYHDRFLSAFPELREVIYEVRKNERIIKYSDFNMKNPGVARYYYRFVNISKYNWSKETREKFLEAKWRILDEYDSLPYDEKVNFGLRSRIDDLRSSFNWRQRDEYNDFAKKYSYGMNEF